MKVRVTTEFKTSIEYEYEAPSLEQATREAVLYPDDVRKKHVAKRIDALPERVVLVEAIE